MNKTIIFLLAFVLIAGPALPIAEQEIKMSREQVQLHMKNADGKIIAGIIMTVGGSTILVLDCCYYLMQALAFSDIEPTSGQGNGKKTSDETAIWMTSFAFLGAGLLGWGIYNCAEGGSEKEALQKQLSFAPLVLPDMAANKNIYGLKADIRF
jgi:hypothetical protein